MIELKNVSKYYNQNGVTNLGLRNVSLSFEKNEIVAITGDSGCGKSTLLNVITKIDTFDEGEIYYKGNETSYFSTSDMDDFRKNKIGFIFQNYNIIDSYTVLENVKLPLILQGVSEKEAAARAKELIAKVGLAGKEKNRGSKLSGGEKQRCVIARALASDCEILACDEPTGNLDSKTGAQIISLIKEVAKDKLVLIVTHDFSQVEKIATRKLLLNDGEVVNDTVFEAKEKTPSEDLDLDYTPLPKKVGAAVAYKNIFFTPIKSLFLGAIFLAIAVAALFVFQFLMIATSTMTFDYAYNNRQTNRIYVYNEDHSPVDLQIIKSVSADYVVNPFYEDTMQEPFGEFYWRWYYNRFAPAYDLFDGAEPKKDATNEILVVLPKDQDYVRVELQRFMDMESVEISGVECKIVGIALSEEVDNIIFTGAPALERELSACQISMTKDGETVPSQIDHTLKKPVLYLPISDEGEPLNVKMTVQRLYVSEFEDGFFDVKYGEEITAPIFAYNPFGTGNLPAFEVSVYADNVQRAAESLQKAGLKADICFNCEREMTDDLIGVLMNFLAVLGIVYTGGGLLLLTWITYFILAKVYESKKKDFQILRTLGITERDMIKIVNTEVTAVGLASTVVGIGVFLFLTVAMPALATATGVPILEGWLILEGLGELSLLTVIGYIWLMYSMIGVLATLFNKKLFKFSVSKSLKGGDFFD